MVAGTVIGDKISKISLIMDIIDYPGASPDFTLAGSGIDLIGFFAELNLASVHPV